MEENAPCNDDTESWITLKAATLNVVRWLEKQKPTDSKGKPDAGNENKSDGKQNSKYVQHRLRELAAFERRARGVK